MAEHSKAQADFIADIIIKEPSLLLELIDIVFQNKEPLSRRASWPLRKISDRNVKIFEPYVSDIISGLRKVESESIQRSLLALLINVKIPEEYHGEMLQYTSEILLNKGSSIAALIYSIDIFYKLSENEPDLLNELRIIMEELIPYGSAGVRSKCNKTIKKINKKHGLK